MTIGKQLRVLLIKPPIEGFRTHAIGSRNVPVGLMYLTHVLRHRCNVDVRILDSLTYTGDNYIIPDVRLSPINQKKVSTSPLFKHVIHFGARWDRIRHAVQEFQPDIVGLTCQFSPYYRQAYFTATLVRQACPTTKIFIGGPHATVAWEDVFARSPVDAIVLGEGEQTFAQLISDLQSSSLDDLGSLDITRYPGLAVRHPNGEVTVNHLRSFITDLDGLGFPVLEDMDFARYDGVTSIITSRGCPFSCTFCSVHAIVGKAFRARSVDSVIDELKYYAKRGVRVFNIEDDNFTFDMDRVDQIMEAICRVGLKIELRFPNGITALKMTAERLQLFARAGVTYLFFGLESADTVTRKRLKKGMANLDDIEQVVHAARSEGIYAFATLIIGLPHQSLKDMADDFVEVFLRGLTSRSNPFYPIKGTELFRQAEADGFLVEDDLEWYESMNFPIQSEYFSRADVAEAFVLGQALAQPDFREYHRKFLQAPQPPSTQELLKALTELHVIVADDSMDDLVLTPIKCFCEEQNLIHRHLHDHSNDPLVEPCAFSGRLLQMTLQLWTRRTYDCEEITCCVTEPVRQCKFHLRSTRQTLTGVTARFLARLEEELSNPSRELLSEEYDRLALRSYNSYVRPITKPGSIEDHQVGEIESLMFRTSEALPQTDERSR